MLQQPFALTLYAFLMLQERDRVAALRKRERDIYLGELIAMSMNEPKRLQDERADVVADMKKSGVPEARKEANDELRLIGEALAARIASGRVLEDS